jgi:sugar phosphate isomerase/epimerase
MDIAGYSYSFFRQLEAETTDTTATVRFFAELGLRSVELAESFIQEGEFDRLKAALAETGLAVACYDLHCDFVQGDPAARATQVTRVKRGLERAADFGAPYVLVVPGESRPGIADSEAREWFVEGLRECLGAARRLGVRMTVPNLGAQAALFGASADVNATCDAVGPDLGVTYDVGNYLMAGEDSLAALDRVAPRVVHVHLKDWHVSAPTPLCLERGGYPGLDGRCYDGAPLGDGVVDLRGAIARLQQLGYRGALSVEYEGSAAPREAVRRWLAYLRSLLSED